MEIEKTTDRPRRRILLGISGASGARYGVRVLEALASKPDIEVHLIVTEGAKGILEEETGRTLEEVAELADETWQDGEMTSPLASGSFPVEAVSLVPCSVSTVAKLSHGIGDTLLTRACIVALKERRRLVIVAREMPLSTIDLKNLARLSEAGAIVAVASPPFYTHPETIEDLIDLVAGRVIDLLGLDPGGLLSRYGNTYG